MLFLCTGTGKLAVHVPVNTGRLPLTREKRVGYRVEWLRHSLSKLGKRGCHL